MKTPSAWCLVWGAESYAAPTVNTPTEDGFKPFIVAKKTPSATTSNRVLLPKAKRCKACGVGRAEKSGLCRKRVCRAGVV